MGCCSSSPKSPEMTNRPRFDPKQYGDFQSDCSGNKKALLIGLLYKGGALGEFLELSGCINDVKGMRATLRERFGFNDSPDSLRVMTDDLPEDDKFRPTRENVLEQLKWLVEGAKKGDSLFIMFSGHAGFVTDKNNEEVDGRDEYILLEKQQKILDDDLHKILVSGLPAGVRLTALFDCCFSGTIMDLPFTYNLSGVIQDPVVNNKRFTPKELLQVGYQAVVGNKAARRRLVNINDINMEAQKWAEEHQKSLADVVLFSSCREGETSADAKVGPKDVGAMNAAFQRALGHDPSPTYIGLLAACREWMQQHFTQVAQISTGYPLDLHEQFKV